MNLLKENWFKAGILAILLISIFGGFYWYEWRPAQIRKECSGVAAGSQDEGLSASRFADIVSENTYFNEPTYKKCLLERGLKG